MDNIELDWNNLVAEPFTWLFCYIFQPNRFKKDFEIGGLQILKRIVPMLKLALPMFICSYLLAVVTCIISLKILTIVNAARFSFEDVFVLDSNVVNLMFLVAQATIQGIILGIILGIVLGIRFGITLGIALAITMGIALGSGWSIGLDFVWSTAWAIINDIAGSIALGGIAGGSFGGLIGTIAGGFLGSLPVSIIEISVENAIENSADDTKYIVGIIVGGIAGIIVGGFAGIIVGGFVGNIIGSIPGGVAGGIAGGIIGGISGSRIGNKIIIKETTENIIKHTTRGAVGDILKDLKDAPLKISDNNFIEDVKRGITTIRRFIEGILKDLWQVSWKISWRDVGLIARGSGMLGIIGGLSGFTIGLIMGFIVLIITSIIALFITLPFALGISGSMLLAITLILILVITRHATDRRLLASLCIAIPIVAILVMPSAIASSLGRLITDILPNVIVSSLSLSDKLIIEWIGRVTLSIALDIIFIAIYFLCYYRLLLYPISGLAGFGTLIASLRNPLQVFAHLHRSSLYWDEYVLLPLPYLKQTLLIAAEQNIEQVLEEISYIVVERPQQMGIAREVSLEIAIHEMGKYESLHAIAEAAQRLDEILQCEAGLMTPQLVMPFTRFKDASQDAARYYSPITWQARRDTLENMIATLKKFYPNSSFKDAKLNKYMDKAIDSWLAIAQQEQEKLEKLLETSGKIRNPYNPGQVLEQRNSPFVGRRDLVRQLEEALGQGNRRPTFLLNGERRMGKSSTLKQLPYLLAASYIPVFFNLQNPKMLSSTPALLCTMAEEIYKVISSKELLIRKLECAHLQEAKNEAEAYLVFDEWLEGLEGMLEQRDSILLLVFDEFESLEEARRDGYLNLRLLLDWFRSVIQYRPQLALLFSGLRTFGEMGPDWAGYFVNVQTLKVSFLKELEARKLIIQPVTDFLSKEIFSEDVVEEIIQVTNCHPFLIQAICARLIDNLNASNRNQAEIGDIKITTHEILESWDNYFQDLWNRTDQDQRACLAVIKDMDQCNTHTIEQQSSLDERTILRTIQTLLKRDLVVRLEDGTYRIAALVFIEWVERKMYN